MLTGNVVKHVVTNVTFSSCFSVTSITVFCFRCLLTSINRLCVALWSNTKKISSHKVLLVSVPYPQQRTQLRTVPRLDFRCLLSADFDPPQRETRGWEQAHFSEQQLAIEGKGWFPLSRNFPVRTHVKFTRVNEKETLYERPRVNVKVERGSTLTFTRDGGNPP